MIAHDTGSDFLALGLRLLIFCSLLSVSIVRLFLLRIIIIENRQLSFDIGIDVDTGWLDAILRQSNPSKNLPHIIVIKMSLIYTIVI